MSDSWWVDEKDKSLDEARVAVKDENRCLVGYLLPTDAPMAAAAPQLHAALAEVVDACEAADYGSHEVEITLTKDQLEWFRGLLDEADSGYRAEDPSLAKRG